VSLPTAFPLTAEARAAQRRRGQLAGLAKARAARAAITARRLGAETGWYGRPDWRMNAIEANAGASLLERHGWRAEACALGQGGALVEVRRLDVRGMPLVATLRTAGDLQRFLAEHPGRRPPGPRLSGEEWARCRAG
jgi:hypothetical protein